MLFPQKDRSRSNFGLETIIYLSYEKNPFKTIQKSIISIISKIHECK